MLTEDKFIPEVHLRQPDLHKVRADHLGKKKEECKNIREEKVQDEFIEMN